MHDKYAIVAEVLDTAGVSSVLDVGCRDGVLGRALRDRGAARIAYTGVDLKPGPGVDLVADVSQGLALPDASYDAVAAVDLLEHLDDMQGALDDFRRVSRGHLLVVLPNAAHFQHRVRFLRSGRISGKYDLRLDAGQDRHRWLTVVPQIDDFMAGYARRHDLAMEVRDLSGGPRSGRVERVLRAGGFSRAWTAVSVLYVLKPMPVPAVPGAG